MVPGLSSGTSVIVTANAHVPSRTKRSPPCMLVRVDENVGDGRIRQQCFERAEAEHLVTHVAHELPPLDLVDWHVAFFDDALNQLREFMPPLLDIYSRDLRSSIFVTGRGAPVRPRCNRSRNIRHCPARPTARLRSHAAQPDVPRNVRARDVQVPQRVPRPAPEREYRAR